MIKNFLKIIKKAGEQMRQLVAAVFSPLVLMGKMGVQGEIPRAKEAYQTAFEIAWPSVIETVLVGLIASVDTMMVGGIGPEAIAAVGLTSQPKLIVLAMVMSLNVGVTVIVARRRGENNKMEANRCLRQSLIISLIMSLFTVSLAFIYARPILLIAGAQSDTINMATTYFQIILLGMPFQCLGLTINAAQRGVGNTKISMCTNLAANGVNLIFNYLLINGIGPFPKMGVAGAAIATAMGSVIAFLMAVKSIFEPSAFLYIGAGKDWRFDKKTVSSIFNVSSSAFVEQVCMRIGFLVFAMIIANLGTIAFATHQICMNLINLSFTVGDGLGIASSSLIGQNMGKKRPDLAVMYGNICQRFAMIIAVFVVSLFTFGRKWCIELFSDDPQVLALGMQVVLIIAVTSPIQMSQVIFSGSLRGAGDTRYVAVVSLISITILRTTLSWFLCYPMKLGLIGAWLGLFIDQTLRCLLCFWRFRQGKWAKIQL